MHIYVKPYVSMFIPHLVGAPEGVMFVPKHEVFLIQLHCEVHLSLQEELMSCLNSSLDEAVAAACQALLVLQLIQSSFIPH